jgi:transcriptional regulator with XRE-family HTH domain
LTDNGLTAGTRLRFIRELLGLSLPDVGEMSAGRFSGSSVRSYESGDRNLSVERADAYCRWLGIPVIALFPGEGDEAFRQAATRIAASNAAKVIAGGHAA